MLKDLRVHANIPASNISRARKFYEQVLGLSPSETPGGTVYRCGQNSWFLLYESDGASKSGATIAGWETDDIESEVQELRKRGVVFEEYDAPEFKTVNGINTEPARKAAWFRDSEGNTLVILQFMRKDLF